MSLWIYQQISYPTGNEKGIHTIHLGGVRLILTLHGRKGLLVTARIALHDARFKQYQHAVIGTVLTTLHAGSVLLIFYPNFNLSLEDPNLPTTLKVQIQLQGAEQTSTSKIATLHHQISNLPIYGFSSEEYPVYPDKVNGHFLWDVPEAHMCNPDYPCLDDTDDDEDFEIMRRRGRRKKKPSTPKTPCRPYSSEPPDDPESDQPLPIYKKAFRQLQRESSFKLVPAQPKIKSCLMVSSSSQSYQESFPPLERHIDLQTNVVFQPYVQSPITTSGAPEAPKQYEAVLNYSSEQTSLDSKSQYAYISGLLMATKTEDPSTYTPVVGTLIAEESSDDNDNVQGSQTEPTPSIPPVSEKSSKPSSSPWFTFDDIPRHKWQARHQEFAAWIDVQMTSPNAQS
ncbi:hypothetical protein KPL71_021577 [Citrus sinensis]|uniref:Uncharacterized protein n=1 Tax=Citrus sinensis TaxID=2711 RepID=A0ACB8JGU6_CITSI|nr:hypothetical protein KPL71_021577 [Citrus sinensis]